MNGALQNSFNTFVVGTGGGSVTVTLTSAVETLPDGTLLPTVTMGLGIGTMTSGGCTLLAGAFTTRRAAPLRSCRGPCLREPTVCKYRM